MFNLFKTLNLDYVLNEVFFVLLIFLLLSALKGKTKQKNH